ncbi:MAG: 23S rRNA (adenine(2503)-C(2))-methyltransferase [Bacteroidetes bacterium GWF2_40_14]|nr:MAG: 23S rRNA (adenine(2503)-C(2))-methyltransferase [Bacteroidetes bacterium GWF2_40_14]
MKKWLLGNSLAELKEITESLFLPSFTAKQLADWLYKKKASDIALMTNLSRQTRERLSEEYEVGGFTAIDTQISSDGTKKYLFPSICGTPIEAVMIPDEDRATLCISSQAGCKMGCKFCMTGRMGFKGQLTAGEIISQFINIEESDSLTNFVFMGMGEPLDNMREVTKSIDILTSDWGFAWSPRRITVSSIGIYPELKEFLENSKCHLAISLHNPFDEERNELIPMQKAYPISDTVELIRDYDFTGQRRVSFEYIMFNGWNDDKRHADGLIRMLKNLECRVNLIRFHKIPDFPLSPSQEAIIELFQARLNKAGILTTLRSSRGEDILAACGMLSGKNK